MFNFGSMQTQPNEQTVMSLPDWPSIIGCCHVARQLVCVGLAASARWQTNWCQLVMELLLLRLLR